jgi:transposase-like protein
MIPPYCPYKECPQHFEGKHLKNWYRHFGFHCTDAFGKVQRYQCKSCGRTFSDQTFSLNYYAKRVIDYEQLFRQLRSTAGIRYMIQERFRWRPFRSLLNLTPVQKGLWFRLYTTPLKGREEYFPKYVFS